MCALSEVYDYITHIHHIYFHDRYEGQIWSWALCLVPFHLHSFLFLKFIMKTRLPFHNVTKTIKSCSMNSHDSNRCIARSFRKLTSKMLNLIFWYDQHNDWLTLIIRVNLVKLSPADSNTIYWIIHLNIIELYNKYTCEFLH